MPIRQLSLQPVAMAELVMEGLVGRLLRQQGTVQDTAVVVSLRKGLLEVTPSPATARELVELWAQVVWGLSERPVVLEVMVQLD